MKPEPQIVLQLHLFGRSKQKPSQNANESSSWWINERGFLKHGRSHGCFNTKSWSDDLDERKGYPHFGNLHMIQLMSSCLTLDIARGHRWSPTTLLWAAVKKPCFGHLFCNFWAAHWRYLKIFFLPSCCGFVRNWWNVTVGSCWDSSCSTGLEGTINQSWG